jgi:KDO2-lipid IV(A) lauroyltransferase
LRWGLETATFILFSFGISLIPDRIAFFLGNMLGRMFFLLIKRRRTIAIDNITASLPFLQAGAGWNPAHGTAEAIAGRTFENLGRSLVEDCKIYHGRGRHIIDAVDFRGLEHYENALAKKKGVAFITAHCGNWEVMALSFGARIKELSVIARRQDNTYLNNVLEKIRSAYGNRVIYKHGALKPMVAEFRKNNIVGVLVDQAVMPDEGVLVKFLGRNCWTTKLPTIISRKTGVPLIPAFVHREGDRHVVQFYPEVEPDLEKDGDDGVRADTAALLSVLEDYIVSYPDQWYWIHNRWKRAPQS